MFNKIELFYRRNSVSIKIIRRYWISCLLSFLVLWLFYSSNLYFVSVIVVVISVICLKKYCEKLLCEKLIFNFNKENRNYDNCLSNLILKKDIEIMKKYTIDNNLYNIIVIDNIVKHYRNFLTFSAFKISFFELLTLVVTIIVPFVNADGFDIDLFIKNLPYFLIALIILALFYFFLKKMIGVVNILMGKDFLYTRL